MKLVIAGSRTITGLGKYWFRDTLKLLGYDCTLSAEYVDDTSWIEEVVSGCASGVDQCGEKFAKSYHIPIKKFPAEWGKYGPSAGPIRNKQMAQYGDALLLIWDGQSRGSASMKKEMKALGKPVFEVIVNGNI